LSGILKEGHHSEYLNVDGTIILEWISEKYGGKLWTEFVWLRKGLVAGSGEYGNELSPYMKGEEFPE
jgi:hypothetical protein